MYHVGLILILRFTGIAGNSLSSFNGDIITDEYGNASGIVLVPAGFPPLENSSWTGDINTVSYDTSAEEINIYIWCLDI